jgi:nitrite reductase/ring-hydroxylating ferredoxin subunit
VTDDAWVPVALSNAIEPSTSAGTLIDGREVVVWRDGGGIAHVWEDRCPHRGMRMSFGFVRGDHIACLYHGWEYDAAGQCRHIPAHPDLEVPATIRVKTFAAEERNGLIWTRLANGADLATVPETGSATPVRSIHAAVAIDAAEALLARSGEAMTRVGDLLWTLRAASADLIVAAQRLSPDRTGLHVLVAGQAEAPARLRAARWAEGLRIALEDPRMADAVEAFA